MRVRRDHAVGLLAALLFAASSALLGWAHAPAGAARPALSGLLPPGAVAADLCLSAPSDPQAPAVAAVCDACLLAKAALTPPSEAVVDAPGARSVAAARPEPAPAALAPLWRPAQARAPPRPA
jgi:hypothetical protein